MRLIIAVALTLFVLYPRTCDADTRYGLSIVRGVTASDNLDSIGEAFLRPLLIFRNAVYVVDPECWPRNAGAGSNVRDGSAGNNQRTGSGAGNDRDGAGNANSRSRDGRENDRSGSGGGNERDDASGNNLREIQGSSNERRETGNANARMAGGGALSFHCRNDEKGLLHIYFENCRLERGTQIFYRHRYYKPKSKSFKIHTQ